MSPWSLVCAITVWSVKPTRSRQERTEPMLRSTSGTRPGYFLFDASTFVRCTPKEIKVGTTRPIESSFGLLSFLHYTATEGMVPLGRAVADKVEIYLALSTGRFFPQWRSRGRSASHRKFLAIKLVV